MLLRHHLYLIQVGHLNDDAVVAFRLIGVDGVKRQHILLGDVFLISHSPDTRYDLLNHLHIIYQLALGISGSRHVERCQHDAFALATVVEMLPKLFRDEGHKRMQHLKQHVEEVQRSLIRGLIDGLSVLRLHHFEIPTGEFVPEQAVNGHQSLADTVSAELLFHHLIGRLELGSKPLHGCFQRFGLCHVGCLPALHQAEGIPNLIVEVAALLAQALIKENIVARGS